MSWYQHLWQSTLGLRIRFDDFRGSGVYIFQALSTFCTISNKTASASLNDFLSTEYVTAAVSPIGLFQSQTQTLFDEFVSSTRKDFSSSLQAITDFNQANAIMSVIGRGFRLFNGYDDNTSFPQSGMTDSTQPCLISLNFVTTLNIFDLVNSTVLFAVPGFYVRCVITDALLQSSLICFYDQACIDRILYYTQFNASAPVTALTTATSDQYFANSTVKELLDQLMIDIWHFSAEHDSYFNSCQPVQCTYTQVTKNGALVIITTLFGLIGGLVKVLRFFVPLLVNQISKLIKRIHTRPSQLTNSDIGKLRENRQSDRTTNRIYCGRR